MLPPKNYSPEILEDIAKFKESGGMSLADLKHHVDWLIYNVRMNKRDPNDIPVLLHNSSEHEDILSHRASLCYGERQFLVKFEFWPSDNIDYSPADRGPVEGGGEEWKSRGPSSFDCSGFVHSKQSGERLLEIVKTVLNKRKCETWLDYRKLEPTWIQFKFSAEEFDVNKLDEMARANNDVLTQQILEACKL